MRLTLQGSKELSLSSAGNRVTGPNERTNGCDCAERSSHTLQTVPLRRPLKSGTVGRRPSRLAQTVDLLSDGPNCDFSGSEILHVGAEATMSRAACQTSFEHKLWLTFPPKLSYHQAPPNSAVQSWRGCPINFGEVLRTRSQGGGVKRPRICEWM